MLVPGWGVGILAFSRGKLILPRVLCGYWLLALKENRSLPPLFITMHDGHTA